MPAPSRTKIASFSYGWTSPRVYGRAQSSDPHESHCRPIPWTGGIGHCLHSRAREYHPPNQCSSQSAGSRNRPCFQTRGSARLAALLGDRTQPCRHLVQQHANGVLGPARGKGPQWQLRSPWRSCSPRLRAASVPVSAPPAKISICASIISRSSAPAAARPGHATASRPHGPRNSTSPSWPSSGGGASSSTGCASRPSSSCSKRDAPTQRRPPSPGSPATWSSTMPSR